MSASGAAGARRWRKLWNWGLPSLMLPAALLLNPDETQHRETLRAAIAAGHPVAAGFDAQERAVPDLRYQSFGVLSLTRHRHELTTLGAFGKVVAVGKRGRRPG